MNRLWMEFYWHIDGMLMKCQILIIQGFLAVQSDHYWGSKGGVPVCELYVGEQFTPISLG